MLWPLCFSRVPLVSAGNFHAHLISLDMLQVLDFFESFSFQSGSRRGWRESNLNIETLNHPLLADWPQMADIWLPSSLSRQSQPPLESYILNPLSLLWCVFVGVRRIALIPWSKTLHYTVLVESEWFSWESFAAEWRDLVSLFFSFFFFKQEENIQCLPLEVNQCPDVYCWLYCTMLTCILNSSVLNLLEMHK